MKKLYWDHGNLGFQEGITGEEPELNPPFLCAEVITNLLDDNILQCNMFLLFWKHFLT